MTYLGKTKLVLEATFPDSLLLSCDQRELKLLNHLGGFGSWLIEGMLWVIR